MQGAELEVDDHDHRRRLRTHDVAAELQRVHGRVAAHEADDRAFDRGLEAASPDNLEIEAGRRKPGAAGHDEMAYAPLVLAELQLVDRAGGQDGRMHIEEPHA